MISLILKFSNKYLKCNNDLCNKKKEKKNSNNFFRKSKKATLKYLPTLCVGTYIFFILDIQFCFLVNTYVPKY